MEMKDFYTREVSNTGKRVPLYRPDGTLSDEHFVIRGVDSDTFRRADLNAKRKMMEAGNLLDDIERADVVAVIERELVSSLVVEWSFPQECSPENVSLFFKEAPQLQKMVNVLAAQRSFFFEKELKPSSTGLKKTRS